MLEKPASLFQKCQGDNLVGDRIINSLKVRIILSK